MQKTTNLIPDKIMPDAFYRIPTISALSGKPPSTLFRDIREGRFPPFEKIGPNQSAMRGRDYLDWAADPMGWSEKHRKSA